MNWERSLDLLEVHCQGEIGKVIVGGAPRLAGGAQGDQNENNKTVRPPRRGGV